MEDKKILELMKEMSLAEKIGQLIQVTANEIFGEGNVTGPDGSIKLTEEDKKLVGSSLGKVGKQNVKTLQENFMKNHPHHIPLLFMTDVINGQETIYPIPLAQGCMFSPETSEELASAAAKEATNAGVHVTYSPMLDLVRDARWGRVLESTGEDPWLNAQIGKAMIRGYQGGNRLEWEKGAKYGDYKLAGCLKHFAAYGAGEGGRDYDNVEISEITFREDYLPAYKAAVEEGVAVAMASFNTFNRVPAHASKWLMRKLLRGELGFDGLLVSDHSGVHELVNHGVAADDREATKMALEAGIDIDMASNAYGKHLPDLIASGEISEALLDESVYRVLKLKNDLGLFENPYRDTYTQDVEALYKEHRKLSRASAAQSFVLLKNEGLLPLGKEKLAFIGPWADEKTIYGAWSFPDHPEVMVTLKEGLEARGVEAAVHHLLPLSNELSSETALEDPAKVAAAIEAAKAADKVVLCLGQHRDMSGEASSRVHLTLPENQLALLKEVAAVNENIVLVLFAGRPVVLTDVLPYVKSALIVWMPGTEGGNAICDVLFGDKAPEGKLSMSLPRHVGQYPLYYNRLSTGRSREIRGGKFVNGYIDIDLAPLYPFGYGLSYTEFAYSEVSVDKANAKVGETVTASVTLTNVGSMEATETVQLYLHDVVGSVARPVKSLRGVQKVTLAPGESRVVSFEITEDMLKFYNELLEYVCEPGEFEAYIGGSSDTKNKAVFRLV